MIYREVFDVSIDSLPSYNTGEDKSTNCDVCIRKGVEDQPAVTYCIKCEHKFCAKHEEVRVLYKLL